MTDKTVAKRYARALFAIGEEQGKSEVFAENLKELAAMLKENEELATMLNIQSIETGQKKNVMKTILKDMEPMVQNFVGVVLDKGRVAFLGAMCEAYQSLMEQAANVLQAVVKSAVPLSAEQVSQIENKFAALMKQNVKAQTMVDPSLIGGVQVTIGDKVYDGSIANQLRQLSNTLKEQRC
ncbi:MAG: F0F1 ATP synthase subunit delta [Bacillota bacterium]|nr:F0F1 ATP synthase subunit delta [Bacillota bacterium]